LSVYQFCQSTRNFVARGAIQVPAFWIFVIHDFPETRSRVAMTMQRRYDNESQRRPKLPSGVRSALARNLLLISVGGVRLVVFPPVYREAIIRA
jgi:hypothetical protein